MSIVNAAIDNDPLYKLLELPGGYVEKNRQGFACFYKKIGERGYKEFQGSTPQEAIFKAYNDWIRYGL